MIDDDKVLVQIQEKNKTTPLFVYKKQEYVSDIIKHNFCFYENHVLHYIAEKYPIQNNIIDVGAFIGNHSRYFASFLEYNKIFAFEPQELNFSLLERNVRSERCIPFNCALGSCRAKCEMALSDENRMDRAMIAKGSKTDLLPLDDFNIIDVTLLKIDVVQFEYQVLLGGMRTILKYLPTIFIETENSEVVQLLALLGYERQKMFYEGNASLPNGAPTIEFVHRSKL
jgi:FkbM family methyltransferase